MAASNTVLDIGMGSDGLAYERGTWTSSGGTTTLTITAGSGTNFPTGGVKIAKLDYADFGVTGDTNLAKHYTADNAVKITFTANESGTYMLKGKAV